MSNITNAEQTKVWSEQSTIAAAPKIPCLTELSALGLISGAVVLSAVLWAAIFTVL